MAKKQRGTWPRLVKWAFIGVIAVAVMLVVVLVLVLAFFPGSFVGPTPAALQLLPLSQNTGIASPEGTWTAGSGSMAGFRVQESFLTESGTIVGRSPAVTGSIVVVQSHVSSGSFLVDLSKVTVGGKPNASFFQLLDTSKYPDATLKLRNPIEFSTLFSGGHTASATVDGLLTMRGITHTVTCVVTARYNGTALEALGSVPIVASDWGIHAPFAVHNHATIEFLVVLHRG